MAKPRIIGRLREDRGQWMLVSPERGFVLSETARAIVELCDGTRDEEEIVRVLGEKFSGDAVTIRRDVANVLGDLRKRALVEDEK